MELTQLTDWLQKNAVPDVLGNLVLMTVLVLLALLVYYLIQIGNQHVPESRQLTFGLEQFKLIFFISLGSLLLIWLFMQQSLLLSLLTPFIIAGVIAYALNPAVLFLTKYRFSRLQAVIGLFLFLILALLLLSLTLLPRLGDDIRDLGEQLPYYSREWYHSLSGWYETRLAAFSFLPDSLEQVVEFFGLEFQAVTNWLLSSLGTVIRGASSLISSLVTLVTVPVLTFYFMKDGDQISAAIQKMVPPASRSWIFPLSRQIDHVLAGFIRGQLIVAVIVGILSGTALLILGIDFAIILGIIAGITNIIPYLGPFIGAVPAVLMALLTSPLKTLWVVAAFVVIQQVESSIISPRIVGHRVGLHPILMILSLLVGGALWGLVGLIIAVPLAGIIRVLFLEILEWFKRRYPAYFEPKD
ncbi:MAG: AI-2E family transporter [Bacillota bacterium]|nr:AI-2E family transporter [Bacillota bacterium]MDW7676526.1 AI-2E family transporter [Bacillota bacterium]